MNMSNVFEYELSSDSGMKKNFLDTIPTTPATNVSSACHGFEEAKTVIHIVEFYVPPIVLSVGFIGNLLSFLVMIRKSNRKHSTCIFMAALAVADNVVLLCWLLQWLLDYYVGKYILTTWVCKTRKYFVMTMFRVSGWFIVVMSIDKAIAVNFPMKAAQFCSAKTAKIAVAVVTCVLFATNIQYLIVAGLVYFKATGKTQCIFAYATGETLSIINISGLVSGTIIPISLILFANISIIIGIYRANRNKLSYTGSNRRPSRCQEARLTRSLLFVAFAFLFFVSPFRILILIKNEMTLTKCSTGSEIMAIVSAIFRSFLFVNSAVNFLLYCIGGGAKFRNELYQILAIAFCKKIKHPPQSSLLLKHSRTGSCSSTVSNKQVVRHVDSGKTVSSATSSFA